MTSALQTAHGVDDLLRIDDPAIPYAFGAIFPQGGWLARRRAARKLQLLKELDPVLSGMLGIGERVTCVSWGQEYSFVESYFLGLWAWFVNRRAVVLTNNRILVLQLDHRRRLRSLRSQVRYWAIRKVQRGMLGYVRLVFRQGHPLLLTGLPRADKKQVRERIEQYREEHRGDPPVAQGLEYLCPHCSTPIPKRVRACPDCHGAFKSANRAGLLSLLLPGLGDWYLGYKALGAFEILGTLLIWGAVVGAALTQPSEEAQALTPAVALGLAAAPVFLLVHGVDALVTRHTGRKGLYPA